MRCGWGCGAQLTGRNMRAHFTICAKRPAASDHVDRGWRSSRSSEGVDRGRRCCVAGALRRHTHGEPEVDASHRLLERLRVVLEGRSSVDNHRGGECCAVAPRQPASHNVIPISPE
jgi:hypothetical protein